MTSILSLAVVLSAQFIGQIPKKSPSGMLLRGETFPHFLEWKDYGDKSPYHIIKQDLLARIKSGTVPSRDSLESLSKKYSDDPVLAFKFGVVTVETLRGKDGETQRVAQNKAFIRMVRAKNPKDYEYTRLAYFVSFWRNRGTTIPIDVHKRICFTRPDDDDIVLIAADQWSNSPIESERVQAIERLRKLHLKIPENTHFHSRYAGAWAIHAMLTKNKADAINALKVYEEYAKKAKGKYDEAVVRERLRILRDLAK